MRSSVEPLVGIIELLLGTARAAANWADCCARSSARTSLAQEVDGGATTGGAVSPKRLASALCCSRPAFWRSRLGGRSVASSWSVVRPAPNAVVVVGATGGATVESGWKKLGVVTAIGLGRGSDAGRDRAGAVLRVGKSSGAVEVASVLSCGIWEGSVGTIAGASSPTNTFIAGIVGRRM